MVERSGVVGGARQDHGNRLVVWRTRRCARQTPLEEGSQRDIRLGFEAVVIESACRAIDFNGSLAAAWTGMQEAGVERIGDLD